jgi:hypothetical protein
MNMPAAQLAGFDPARTWTFIQAMDMKRDLKKFLAEAWHVVEPGKEFKGGWHIDAICEHLTYVSLGDIDDLVINIPPSCGLHGNGHGKPQRNGCSLLTQAPSPSEIR